MATMKAAVMYGPNDIRYEDTEKPVCPQDGLILKIMAVGLCGSDIRNLTSDSRKGNYRKDKGHDHLTGRGQQIISGLQGLTAGMEGNQKHPCRQGKRGMEELPALCRAVLRHAQVEQRSPRI